MSSSDEDDERGRIAFTTEGDYEDGQWMDDGEFYARGQRQGRRMTKEEALYGYDDDSDGGGRRRRGGGGGGRGRGRRDKGAPLKAVNFISSSSVPESRKRPREEEDEEEEGDRPGLGLGASSGSGSRARGGLGYAPKEEEEEEEAYRPGLGLGARLAAKGPEGEGEGDVKGKFHDLLRAGGASGTGGGGGGSEGEKEKEAAAAGKGQDFFRGVLQDAEAKAAAAKAEEERVKALKALPVRDDPNAMKWEAHTKGFASKYLAKFGFKGRLGKEEQGITKVPEVVVRPERLGLGIMKEATQLRANREIEADLHGKELEVTSDDEKEAGRRRRRKGKEERDIVSIAEQLAREEANWKKGGKPKKPHKKLTVKDVLSMERDADFVHEGEEKKQVIVDLRGPQAKLLTRLDEINYEMEAGTTAADEPPKLGQELLHNVNLLVDLCESGLYGLDRRLKQEQARLDNLCHQVAALGKRVEEGEEKSDRLGKVAALIERVAGKIEEAQGEVPLDAVLKVFRTLKEHFWPEYLMFELWELAPSLLSPVLSRLMQSFDPLHAASRDTLLTSLARWKPVLGGPRETYDSDEEGGVQEQGMRANPLLMKAGEAVLHEVVRRVLLPKVRSALVNQWEVRNVEPAVSLLESLRGLVRADDWDGLCTTVLMPKLVQAVHAWNPREDTVPIHQWIHPWLPILGQQLTATFPEIRRKLSQVLVEWHPSDASAHIILAPWATVFDPRSFEALLLKSILPKLVQALRTLPIVPHNQDLQPLEWVFAWADLLSPLHFLSLLEGELFPKWLQVLHSWLASPTADFAEIADWFEGWKQLLPPQVQADPRIAAHFTHALQAMNHTMDPSLPPLAPPAPLEHISYLTVVEDRRRELVAQAAHAASTGSGPTAGWRGSIGGGLMGAPGSGGGSGGHVPGTRPTAVPPVNVSFKDLVEIFAEKHGVLLLPRPGKTVNGRQVYAFGGVPIYLDSDVVFADLGGQTAAGGGAGGGGGFAPIALEELLQHVQSGGR